MRIKICGLTRRDDATLAETLGADYLGAIMAGGPRNLTEREAAHVLGPRRHSVQRAIVFGTQSVSEIVSIARNLVLDVVQLHGDPTPTDIEQLRALDQCAVWPVLRVEGSELPSRAFDLASSAGWLVLDARVPGQLGGTGTPLDWLALRDQVRDLRVRVPQLQLVLAGGLKASNVRQAIDLLEPEVVDVSSGVELSPGVKDPAALTLFMTTVRQAVRTS